MTRIRFGGSRPQPPLSPLSGTPRRTGRDYAHSGEGQGETKLDNQGASSANSGGPARGGQRDKNRDGSAGALRYWPSHRPLFPAWLASEYDTSFLLWNDWTQTFGLPAGLGARLVVLFGGLGLDVAVAAIAVAAVGVFTPVALSEHRDFRGALVRSWRLMSGGRRKMVALYLVLFVVVVIVSAIGGIAAVWLRSGGRPNVIAEWTVRALSTVIVDFWGVFIAASYLDLRRLHEGALPDQLAEDFA